MTQRGRIAFGVDGAPERLVVVEARRARGGPAVRVVHEGPAGDSAAAAVKKALEAGAPVAGEMGVSESFTRWLQTPLASVSKARKVLPSLLDIQLPFPLESCAHLFVRVKRTAEGLVDALAVAARIDDVQARLALLKKAGAEPTRLDHEGLAVWTQSLRELPIERGGIRVVASLGTTGTALVVGRGEDYLGSHAIRTGARDIAAAPGPFATRAIQILRAQLAEPAGQPIQWVWTGPGAADDAARAAAESALSGKLSARFLAHKDPSSFLARALAVRALEPRALDCDFRTGDLAHPAVLARAERARTGAAAALLAAGLLLCALNAGWRLYLRSVTDRIDAALVRQAKEIAGAPSVPRGQEVLVCRRAVEERAPLLQPFLDAFRPGVMELTADLLAAAHKSELYIESLSLRRDAADVRGSAPDWTTPDTLAAILQSRGYQPQVERQDAGADERVHFSIQGGRARE